jgi:hypothetical protein
MTRYRVLAWDGIPAQLKLFEEGRPPRSVALDPWFTEHIDRVAMERGLLGSGDYLDRWEWSADAELEGTGDEVAAAVSARIEAEWGPRRRAWEQGADAADV